ncbi:hypothetical protein CBM2595_A30575 [Cupriavidus taiwanensis]|nr:hypothetical protein CBM2595_A30575 [Cupriavidus taiwanensis]
MHSFWMANLSNAAAPRGESIRIDSASLKSRLMSSGRSRFGSILMPDSGKRRDLCFQIAKRLHAKHSDSQTLFKTRLYGSPGFSSRYTSPAPTLSAHVKRPLRVSDSISSAPSMFATNSAVGRNGVPRSFTTVARTPYQVCDVYAPQCGHENETASMDGGNDLDIDDLSFSSSDRNRPALAVSYLTLGFLRLPHKEAPTRPRHPSRRPWGHAGPTPPLVVSRIEAIASRRLPAMPEQR